MPHLPEMRGYMHEALEALEQEVAAVLAATPEVDPHAAIGPAGAIAGSGKDDTGARRPARKRTPKKTRAKKAGARKAAAAKQ
jgi:hypothetical protein